MPDIGHLPDNKLFSLAMHGYNAYQPEYGIFCGGYQGPLYPNPTTLSYPGFDPYQHIEPTATEYTPDTQYTGLGAGNPGIDYKNPGHIIGLVDTFGRMSYGIGMMLAVHEGSDGAGGTSPVIDISLPMLAVNDDDNGTFGMSDLYPAIAEVPSVWPDSFTILPNGSVYPDPRRSVTFSAGAGHTPDLGVLDAETLNGLFVVKSVLSYYGMPQYLRATIEALAAAAEPLTEKAELDFTLDSPHMFNYYGHQTRFFPEIDDLHHCEIIQEGLAVSQCKTLTPGQALKTLTGSDGYHNGANDMNEYRSLTELNSVVNLVPVQVIGATYWLDIHGYRQTSAAGGGWNYEVDDWSPRAFLIASYMIVDFVLNVSDIPVDPESPEPGTVTIAGTATVKPIITNPEAFRFSVTTRPDPDPDPGWQFDAPLKTMIWGGEESVQRQAGIAMSMTNKYAWDKAWLGGSSATDDDVFSDTLEDWTLGGHSDMGFIIADTTPLEVPFSKTFTLGGGCNTVRMRIICRNRHIVSQAQWYMVPPDRWLPYSIEYPDWIFMLPNIGEYITVYPRWLTESNWDGDPTTVKDAVDMANIEVAFTVAGTKFDPIPFEVSL